MFDDDKHATVNWAQAIPALRDFAIDIQGLFDPSDHDTLFTCRRVLEQLLASDWLERLVSTDLQRMADAPMHAPTGTSETRMTLLAREGLTLSLLLTMPEPPGTPRKLVAASRNAVLGAWGPGTLEVRRLFQPYPFPTEIIDRSRRLEDRGVHQLYPGETTSVRTGHDVIVTRAVEAPVVLLVLQADPTSRFHWRYDQQSHLPVAMLTGTNVASRLEFAAGVLARLADSVSIPTLQRLFWHPDHRVRWAALRGLMRIERSAGHELLEAALQDPHPQVRDAARTAYDRLHPATPIAATAT